MTMLPGSGSSTETTRYAAFLHQLLRYLADIITNNKPRTPNTFREKPLKINHEKGKSIELQQQLLLFHAPRLLSDPVVRRFCCLDKRRVWYASIVDIMDEQGPLYSPLYVPRISFSLPSSSAHQSSVIIRNAPRSLPERKWLLFWQPIPSPVQWSDRYCVWSSLFALQLSLQATYHTIYEYSPHYLSISRDLLRWHTKYIMN